MIEKVAAGLALANLLQLLFWSYQVQKLINKLMSRNFAEYNQLVNATDSKEAELTTGEHLGEDHDALDELNALIPS